MSKFVRLPRGRRIYRRLSDVRSAGFTLVELMVVIVIIGLASAAVVLALPEPGGSLRTEAERFAARARAARDLAIIEARPISLEVDAAGYQVRRRARGRWGSPERYPWRAGTVAQASGQAEGTRFDTTGLAEPFRLALTRGEQDVVVEIRLDGTIDVHR